MRRGKAEEATNLPLFLFLLIIIGGGLVSGWYVYFGPSPDGRVVYAEDLADRLTACLARGLLETPSAWSKLCNLHAETIRTHYAFILCKEGQACEEGEGIIREGSHFQVCGLTSVRNERGYPICVSRTLLFGGENYRLLVLARVSLLEVPV
jgi:hypothetical protein